MKSSHFMKSIDFMKSRDFMKKFRFYENVEISWKSWISWKVEIPWKSLDFMKKLTFREKVEISWQSRDFMESTSMLAVDVYFQVFRADPCARVGRRLYVFLARWTLVYGWPSACKSWQTCYALFPEIFWHVCGVYLGYRSNRLRCDNVFLSDARPYSHAEGTHRDGTGQGDAVRRQLQA